MEHRSLLSINKRVQFLPRSTLNLVSGSSDISISRKEGDGPLIVVMWQKRFNTCHKTSRFCSKWQLREERKKITAAFSVLISVLFWWIGEVLQTWDIIASRTHPTLPLAVRQHVTVKTVTKERDRVSQESVIVVDRADVQWLGITCGKTERHLHYTNGMMLKHITS